MKKTLKKLLSALLVAVMLMSAAPITTSAWWSPAKAEVYESGSCGSNAQYTCDKKTGKLVISGTGKIDDDSFARSDIRSVIIENGITEICSGAFAYCENMTSITMPDGVTRIGYGAFYQCVSLTSITMPDSVTSIADYAFRKTGYYNDESNWENDVLYIGNHLIKAKSTLSGTYEIKDGTKTIADCAFIKEDDIDGSYCHLTDITIPDSVTSIGCDALYCYNESNWENDVLYIGNHLIKAESTLSGTYEIKDGTKTIASYAFGWLSDGLKSVTIPDSVTNIGDGAFYYCQGLTRITIGNGVTNIGSKAFCMCTGLTSINIPNGVTCINDYTFYACNNLANINIPGSVTSIGKESFYQCKCLENIKIDEKNTVYDSRNNCNAIIETQTNTLIQGSNNTVIPDDVTSIDKYAFYYCTDLRSITIPDSVTDIGDYAFYECPNLADVKFGNGLKIIGNFAFSADRFSYSGSLTQIVIPDNVISIGDSAFERQRLVSVTLGKGVKSIGASAFSCTSLTNLVIPDSVTSIGNSAFSGCTGLTSIKVDEGNTVYDSRNNCNAIIKTETNTLVHGCKNTVIPDSVTSIGYGAFYGCYGLTSLAIPNSVTSIDGYAFYNTGLTSITIPNSASIGDMAFYGTMYYYNALNWENDVLYIGNHLIEAKDTISGAYIIKNGTKTIARYAFSGCSGLTSIAIPDSVTSIDGYTFYDCTGLTSITIPNSVTSIGEDAFSGCTGLTSIAIPDSVTSIGEDAFRGCSGLTSITIPDGVTSIGNSAFYHCSGLASVTIGNSVTSIGEDAFRGCSGLTSITIPDSVTSIGNSAFYDCTGLTSISIPDSVISIGMWAFVNTGYYNDESNWENDVLYIGNHLIKAIETISGAYTIKSGTKTIADDAFSYGRSDIGYSGLTSIIIPDSVTNIGNLAFYTCESLTSITIPDSVISIGDSAFSFCRNLKSVKISNSVIRIGNGAFYFCGKLSDVYYSGTNEEWDGISIKGDNDRLIYATIHFNYSSENPEKSVLIDNNAGIKIEYSTELNEGTEIIADEIFDGESIQLISSAYGEVKTKLFNISLQKDGEKVQPSGEVTVKIPLPTDFNPEKVFVTYVDSTNGKVTKIPCEVKDGYVIFKTDHFSYYAIVEMGSGVESVSISNVTMDYKSSKTLNPEIVAADGAEYTVTYSSDSKNVTVDENGKIYAAKRGTANITVTVTDSQGNVFTDTCKVTVEYTWWQWLIKIVLFGWIWY